MVDNQHQKIKGYRDLSEEEINMMNVIKDTGEILDKLIKELNEVPSLDKGWISIGKINLQQGIMALVRSVAQPTTF